MSKEQNLLENVRFILNQNDFSNKMNEKGFFETIDKNQFLNENYNTLREGIFKSLVYIPL